MPAAPRGVQAAAAVASAQRSDHPAQTLLVQELHLEGQDQRHGGLSCQVSWTLVSLIFSCLLLWVNAFIFCCRNLDLSKFCIGQKDEMQQPPIYDLYAVINHYGGMIGGHYTAYARLPSDKNSQRSDVGEFTSFSRSFSKKKKTKSTKMQPEEPYELKVPCLQLPVPQSGRHSMKKTSSLWGRFRGSTG